MSVMRFALYIRTMIIIRFLLSRFCLATWNQFFLIAQKGITYFAFSKFIFTNVNNNLPNEQNSVSSTQCRSTHTFSSSKLVKEKNNTFLSSTTEPNTHQIFNPSRYFVATEMSNSFKKLPRKSSELTREIWKMFVNGNGGQKLMRFYRVS